MDSTVKTLARRYAKAYISSAEEKGTGAAEASSALASTYETMLPYFRTLSRPSLDTVTRLEILEKIQNGRAVAPRLMNFLKLLLEAGRFDILGEIVKACSDIADRKNNIMRVELRSKNGLTEEQLSRLRKIYCPKNGELIFRQVRDGSVLGGFSLRSGDMFVDATVKGRLAALRKRLAERENF